MHEAVGVSPGFVHGREIGTAGTRIVAIRDAQRKNGHGARKMSHISNSMPRYFRVRNNFL